MNDEILRRYRNYRAENPYCPVVNIWQWIKIELVRVARRRMFPELNVLLPRDLDVGTHYIHIGGKIVATLEIQWDYDPGNDNIRIVRRDGNLEHGQYKHPGISGYAVELEESEESYYRSMIRSHGKALVRRLAISYRIYELKHFQEVYRQGPSTVYYVLESEKFNVHESCGGFDLESRYFRDEIEDLIFFLLRSNVETTTP